MIIGITGKYCAGKDHVAGILKEMGFSEIDLDKIGHEELNLRREAVFKRFGARLRREDSSVDRKGLGEIVFSDPKALQELESLLHPGMKRRTAEILGDSPDKNWIINAAILKTLGLHPLCDFILWISAPMLIRFCRSVKRDGPHPLRIIRRIWAQRTLTPQSLGNSVDTYIVRNSFLGENPRIQVESILRDKSFPL